MAGFRNKRFSIYDMMQERGDFRANPANPEAQDNDGRVLYTGPVEYPKMLYHPTGEEVTLVPSETVDTPYGPKEFNKQTAIIHVVVHSAEEDKKYRALGWHDHPAKAIAASGKEAPDMGAGYTISRLEARIAEMEQEKVKAEAFIAATTVNPAVPEGALVASPQAQVIKEKHRSA